MSENINLRPISELPEVESVSEGDKLLINSGGEAKLIDAKKVGGSGSGGGTVYLSLIGQEDEGIIVLCHADKELTQPLDYETGKRLFTSGANYMVSEDGMDVSGAFVSAVWLDTNKVAQAVGLAEGSIAVLFELTFSDTSTD